MKELPHNMIAEVGIIGSLVEHPEYYYHVEYLHPRMFYETENGAIFWAISELIKNSVEEIDSFSIFAKLDSNKDIKHMFNERGIADIQDFIEKAKATSRNDVNEFKQLSIKVLSLSFIREAKVKLESLSKEIVNMEEKNINQLNMFIQDEVNAFSEKYILGEELPDISKATDEAWQEIVDARGEDGEHVGFPSKFDMLSDYFTYEHGECVILGGKVFCHPFRATFRKTTDEKIWEPLVA